MPNRVVYFTPDKNDESLKQTMMLGYDFPSDGDYEDAGLDFYIDANDRVSKIVCAKTINVYVHKFVNCFTHLQQN